MRVSARTGLLILAIGTTSLARAALADRPRVLIIGDSISIGYFKPVQEMLRGEAELVHNPGNAAHTWNGLEKIDSWLGDRHYDVIHFNWGLHDLRYMKDGKPNRDGTRTSTLEQYKENLEKLVRRLEKTGATLIWASTTPVPEGEDRRWKGEEVEFNKAAAEIMARHKIPVDDLYTWVLPELPRVQQPHNVHYTPEGYQFLALQVSQAIRRRLPGSHTPIDAAKAVIGRVLPKQADQFVLEVIPQDAGRDVFEIESRDGRIVLRGNNGVSICSALNWYLKYRCFCQFTWSGSQLNLPVPLPKLEQKVRQVSPHRYRYWFNFCAFSYTLAFWDWSQWEQHIDWMAMHGINAPLAVVGEEATWRAVGRKFGMSDKQIADFLPGPAYLPFGWMGCLDGWGGAAPAGLDRSPHRPATQDTRSPARVGHDSDHAGFHRSRADRPEREIPRGPGFRRWRTGASIPGRRSSTRPIRFSSSSARRSSRNRPACLEPITCMRRNTFIEMSPPSSEPAFLASMGKAVYEAMRSADPNAIWVMQGWLFHNNPKFWQPPQAKAMFGAVPDDRMLLLQMGGDYWKTTEAYYGKPWVWTFIQDFGDKVSLHGDLDYILKHFGEPLGNPKAGKLEGLGAIMEGLGLQSHRLRLADRSDVARQNAPA